MLKGSFLYKRYLQKTLTSTAFYLRLLTSETRYSVVSLHFVCACLPCKLIENLGLIVHSSMSDNLCVCV